MERGNIIAHRGWWNDPCEKNSTEALERALQAGFGVETDFRDLDAALVISHDPAVVGVQTAASFFEAYRRLEAKGRLALNIKADGLQATLQADLDAHGIPMEAVFAFDMSVPDSLGYVSCGIPFYSRASEYEDPASFLGKSSGVWVDNFTGEYPQITRTQRLLEAGIRCCVVSPELHGRSHEEMWSDIKKGDLHKHPLFEICTDFPYQAHYYFGTGV